MNPDIDNELKEQQHSNSIVMCCNTTANVNLFTHTVKVKNTHEYSRIVGIIRMNDFTLKLLLV